MIFQKVGSQGCFRLLFCEVSPEKFSYLVYHFVAENIQWNIQLVYFNIMLGLPMTFMCFINDKKISFEI